MHSDKMLVLLTPCKTQEPVRQDHITSKLDVLASLSQEQTNLLEGTQKREIKQEQLIRKKHGQNQSGPTVPISLKAAAHEETSAAVEAMHSGYAVPNRKNGNLFDLFSLNLGRLSNIFPFLYQYI